MELKQSFHREMFFYIFNKGYPEEVLVVVEYAEGFEDGPKIGFFREHQLHLSRILKSDLEYSLSQFMIQESYTGDMAIQTGKNLDDPDLIYLNDDEIKEIVKWAYDYSKDVGRFVVFFEKTDPGLPF